VSVQENPSWYYSTALGWFFDYLLTPYVSIRTNWVLYPASLDRSVSEFNNSNGQVEYHEIGFSVLRHFNSGQFDPWFGAGPYLQIATLDDVNSYVVYIFISTGINYEISEDVFFCPELTWGIGSRIISSSEDRDVVINVPTGKDFSSSGIVVFMKFGVGKAF